MATKRCENCGGSGSLPDMTCCSVCGGGGLVPWRAKDCPHENFSAQVAVARLLDSGKFMAEVTVRCTVCDEQFRFIGLSAGVNFEHPTVSIDGLTLNAPIEPELEHRLQTSASYQMPAIPKRH